jgi:hypothetical protein
MVVVGWTRVVRLASRRAVSNSLKDTRFATDRRFRSDGHHGQATEAAIVNPMLGAETMTGANDRRV